MTEDQMAAVQVEAINPGELVRPVLPRKEIRARAQTPIKRRRRPPTDDSTGPWIPPEVRGLQNRYGSSVLDQFILGHTTSDILTELIQNEFDAEGSRVEVHLGQDSLEVTGNGKVVDARGWKRLNVVLGTGETVGSDGAVEKVPPKQNGIGSKNFGLRSLFLLGDRIYVRSGGKFTVKDRFTGSPPRPLPDPTSKNRAGVMIDVPFRDNRVGRLEPFTVERELEMLDRLLEHLPETVVKLSQPGSRRNLQGVEVTSERLGRRIVWRQTAQRLGSRRARSAPVQRAVRIQDSSLGDADRGKVTLQELEFQANVLPPEIYKTEEIPTYFRVPGGRIRVGVSLRLSRGHIDLTHTGLFYYPLGLHKGLTGTAVSVNAPFVFDPDRSRIIENEWNGWLLERAADLTIELLKNDWRTRFGPEAFLALRRSSTPADPRYVGRISDRLKSDPCWPTRVREATGKAGLQPAGRLVIPEQEEFDGFFGPAQCLDDSILTKKYGAAVKELACEHGVRPFGLNSLVRLRCAGVSKESLSTQVGDQADYHYPNYEAALSNLDRQVKFARALEAVRLKLTDRHKSDLRNSRSTLAADGSLQAPKDLVRVDPALGDACPVPLSRRLHPSLLSFRGISDRCEPFEEMQWAMDVGKRINAEAAAPEEREALYHYVLSRHGQLRRSVITSLRDSPILKDHRGDWVAPRDVIPSRVAGARDLEAILHFPHPDYAQDRELESRLRFRKRLVGDDLVAMASFVAAHPEQAEVFEGILHRRTNLLTISIVTTLRGISFLRSSTGELEAPQRLFLRNAVTVATLGEGARYVAGTRVTLYRTLGCKDLPSAEDIVRHLNERLLEGRGPDRPDIVYPTLVTALRSEGMALTHYNSAPIVWTERGYQTPHDFLVGSRFPRALQQAVPHVRSPKALVEALQELGAHPQPLAHHWGMLFLWFGHKYRQTGGPVTNQERVILRDAYMRRGAAGLPEGIGDDVRCLLGQDQKLYSVADITASHFVLNDDPELADAVAGQGARVGFADNDEGSQAFFGALNLRSLTGIIGRPQPRIGQERNAPPWFKPSELLERLHSKDFASALAAIGRNHAPLNSISGRVTTTSVAKSLAAITQIVFVHDLELVYQIRHSPVEVRKEVWLGNEQISLVWVGSRREVDQLLAHGLTRILSESAAEQHRVADPINCLLICRTSSEMAAYLRRRGIQWDPPSNDVIDDQVEEDAGLGEPSEDDGTQALIAELAEREKERAKAPEPTGTALPSGESGREQPRETGTNPSTPTPKPLPPLEEVNLKPALVSGNWAPPKRRTTGGGGWRGWSPRTPSNFARDEAVGLRGEELVFREERARIRDLGLDEKRVVWTAENDRTADHDIKSVHDDGGDLFIEVKSTSGRDGRFEWSIAEFEKAAREEDRYELWRVYQADTDTATYKKFRDPISQQSEKKIRMDIASFWAEVEPMNT